VSVERVAAHLLAGSQSTDSWVTDWIVDTAPALTYRAPQTAVDLLTRVRDVVGAADDLKAMAYEVDHARAMENAAVLLAQQGRIQAARSAYATALDVYFGLDALWDIGRADAGMRSLGAQRGVRGPPRRPAAGWEALTASKLTIAGMVAAGRSNPDIAAELFLSRRTVQTHVSHILAKLGAQSRVDIARAAITARRANTRRHRERMRSGLRHSTVA
jgi:DNA-binding CsgD family transcriptional regulator